MRWPSRSRFAASILSSTLASAESGSSRRSGCETRSRGMTSEVLAEFERRHFFRGESEPLELVRMREERNGAVYEAMWGPNEWTMTGALAGWDVRPRLARAGDADADPPRRPRPLDRGDREDAHGRDPARARESSSRRAPIRRSSRRPSATSAPSAISSTPSKPAKDQAGSEATLQGSWRGSGSAPADPDPGCALNQCRGKDSNLRRLSRRVYSPLPLAARAPLRECGQCSRTRAYDPGGAVRRDRRRRRAGGVGDGDPARARRARRCCSPTAPAFRATSPAAAASPAAPSASCPSTSRPSSRTSSARFEVRLGYRKRFERRSEAPLVLMTRRRRLDAFLAEQAAAAGADFRDGVTVEGLTVGPDGATLAVGGARGARARARRRGRRQRPDRARRPGSAAASSTGSRSRGTGRCPTEQHGRATVELGVVPGGYGWVFPKDGHANYGVGGWAARGRGCARTCAASAPSTASTTTQLTDLQGRRLPIRRTTRAAPRPGPARRRRRRARRPALRRRHLRGARLGAARRRRDPRRRRLDDYEEELARGARPLRRDLVEGEARARPPPAGGVRDRADPGACGG